MIRYSISQRTKTLWFYAETKSIKLSQQKLKEHFNVARAPRKPTIQLSWQILNKWIWNIRHLDLNFSKGRNWKCLGEWSSFFDAFVFSYCCCVPFKDKHSCKAKWYLSLTSDKHIHEHFVMIRTIPLIKLLFIYIINTVSLSRPLKHLGLIPLSSNIYPSSPKT